MMYTTQKLMTKRKPAADKLSESMMQRLEESCKRRDLAKHKLGESIMQ